MKLFGKLTTEDLIRRELEQARKALLESETARDYATAICYYNEQRIQRLKEALESME